MPPSSQDLIAGYDPTGQTTITAAELLALVQSATPYNDKGMVIVTTDNAGVPTVPDARDTMGNEKWQKYVWARVQDTTASLYMWSPGSSLDATFLYWISVAISIPVGSIIGDDIADNTIPATKIISVDWAQITGVPTGGFTPTGPAGGSLNGNYPNPGIAPLAVTTPAINTEAVTSAKLSGSNGGAPCVDLTKNIITNGVWPALGMVRVNAAATGLEGVAKLITQLAEPVLANALQLPRVKSDGSGYELVTSNSGMLIQTQIATTAATGTTAVILPYDNTIPDIGEGLEYLTVTITPKSITSLLRVRFSVMCSPSGAGNKVTVALFRDAVAAALQAVGVTTNTTSGCAMAIIDFTVVAGSLAATTFRIRFGPDTAVACFVNRATSTALYGNAANVVLSVEEISQ